MTSTTATETFNPHDDIEKLPNSLDTNETNIDKITDVTHKCLLIVSVTDAVRIIDNMKKNDDDDANDDKQMKLFDEIVQMCYLIKLDSMKEKLSK